MTHSYIDMLASFGVHSAHPGGIDFSKQCLKNEQIDEQSVILDAGCGLCETSAWMADNFDCEIYALDNHKHMLERAKSLLPKELSSINLVNGSVEKMPFSDETFDLVLSESTASFTNTSETLSEYYRVLKPGGTLLAIEMTNSEADNDIIRDYKSFYHINELYSKTEWVDALTNAGFSSIVASPVPPNKGFTQLSPSENIPAEHIQLLNHHQNLVEKSNNKIVGYLYRSKKSSKS
ncbi:class I SAM-dependent methyltransferase [Bacillus solimangrovi]|uniref:Methyltransferase type 11 domain-containing protein n=1 Tax=Bacillus solimangrovi TaxID=1305675 RepID=A0A1E5LE83_9BACI|nr:class I SAM-dependent methyltransferase [Bacillus solimangrovi]OEH92382.1 hypothetical protein BFG57_16195 [Bacillus solimangrovi]